MVTTPQNQILWPALRINSMNSLMWWSQRSARILDPGNSRRESVSYFSLDHEKWFSKVSISSWNTRITMCNLVLASKYENGHMIISISPRQVRTRKIILDLVSKNSREWEWEWDSKSNPITELHSRQLETNLYDFWKKKKQKDAREIKMIIFWI